MTQLSHPRNASAPVGAAYLLLPPPLEELLLPPADPPLLPELAPPELLPLDELAPELLLPDVLELPELLPALLDLLLVLERFPLVAEELFEFVFPVLLEFAVPELFVFVPPELVVPLLVPLEVVDPDVVLRFVVPFEVVDPEVVLRFVVPFEVEDPEFVVPFTADEPEVVLPVFEPPLLALPVLLLDVPLRLLLLVGESALGVPLVLLAEFVAALPVLPGPCVLVPGPPVSLAPEFVDDVVPLVPVPELVEVPLALFELRPLAVFEVEPLVVPLDVVVPDVALSLDVGEPALVVPLLLLAEFVTALPVLPGPCVLLPGPPVSVAPPLVDEVVPFAPVAELVEVPFELVELAVFELVERELVAVGV